MSDKIYTTDGLDPQFCKDILEQMKDLCLDPIMKQMISDTLDKVKENETQKD